MNYRTRLSVTWLEDRANPSGLDDTPPPIDPGSAPAQQAPIPPAPVLPGSDPTPTAPPTPGLPGG